MGDRNRSPGSEVQADILLMRRKAPHKIAAYSVDLGLKAPKVLDVDRNSFSQAKASLFPDQVSASKSQDPMHVVSPFQPFSSTTPSVKSVKNKAATRAAGTVPLTTHDLNRSHQKE